MRGAIVLVAMLLTGAASAQSPDISAQRLLSSWKSDDPMMRMVAEMIAAAFGSGLSWRGSLAGKDIYCPPPGLKGAQVMPAFEKFLEENPDMAERPYGNAMAATLSRAFPCQAH
jgi:Rap1a immunity proteins